MARWLLLGVESSRDASGGVLRGGRGGTLCGPPKRTMLAALPLLSITESVDMYAAAQLLAVAQPLGAACARVEGLINNERLCSSLVAAAPQTLRAG